MKLITLRYPTEIKKFLPKIKALQPTDEDLLGAVEGMLRLQFFYKLKTIDFANGIIDGNQTRSPLSVHDLFVIGEKATLIQGQDYNYFAMEYLKLAYEKQQVQFDDDKEVSGDVLIRRLISVYQTLGNHAKAFEMLEELKIKFPLADEDDYYSRLDQSLHADQKAFGADNVNINDPFSDNYLRDGTFSVLKDRILNSQICRGNISRPTEEISKLRCLYVSTNPFTTLARFKVEEVHLDPYIVLFIDIVSDDELKVIKDSSKLKLSRARSGQEEIVNSRRVAQVSWHYPNEHEIFSRLSRRVEVIYSQFCVNFTVQILFLHYFQDMTGLSLETAEPLQTQNYGIGGHYDGHYDCVTKFDTPFLTYGGNRIATALFYVSLL